MVTTLQVVRALHILAAIAWAGGASYALSVVLRATRQGQAGRMLAAGFFATGRHGPFMAISATATILFGGITMAMGEYGIDAVGLFGANALGIGMTLAIVAWIIGITVHMPTEKKLEPMSAALLSGDLKDESQWDALVAKEFKFSRISMALVGLALLTMMTFRWF